MEVGIKNRDRKVINLNMKKGLLCLSIIAIGVFCTLNVAVASTSNYSTTFHNNARRNNTHMPMARDSTSNGQLKWNSVTEGIAPSTATHSGIVYIGSWDHNVYALNANAGKLVWSYATGSYVAASPLLPTGSDSI